MQQNSWMNKRLRREESKWDGKWKWTYRIRAIISHDFPILHDFLCTFSQKTQLTFINVTHIGNEFVLNCSLKYSAVEINSINSNNVSVFVHLLNVEVDKIEIRSKPKSEIFFQKNQFFSPFLFLISNDFFFGSFIGLCVGLIRVHL